MGKVVINTCFGGFGLSDSAMDMMVQRGYKVERATYGSYFETDIDRHNEDLIDVIETLGDEANGRFADLTIVEFEGNVYQIDEYDGYESLLTPEGQRWIVIE